MSDLARALVWKYYDPRQWGAPIILAIALSDESDDRGGGIFQSNGELAMKTRQDERAVRRQLRALEKSGFVECIERSQGGIGKFNQYAINLAALRAIETSGPGSTTRAYNPGSVPSTRVVDPGSGPGLADHTIKATKDLFVDDGHGNVGDVAEDRRLAEWIFGLLRRIAPTMRSPSWSSWARDIRLMRERDKRTRRQIAELFAWANADPFWQANILSPGTLRRKWEQLELKRNANGGRGAPLVDDKTCARIVDGVRCGKPGKLGLRDSTWRCEACAEEEERERSS